MTTTLRTTQTQTDIAVDVAEQRAAEATVGQLHALPKPRKQQQVTIAIPAELLGLVTRMLDAVAKGERLTVGTMPEELSTASAAEQLGISRPTLMKLIASGEIPAHKVGTHTRVKTQDMTAFRHARIARQQAALDELREMDEDLGI